MCVCYHQSIIVLLLEIPEIDWYVVNPHTHTSNRLNQIIICYSSKYIYIFVYMVMISNFFCFFPCALKYWKKWKKKKCSYMRWLDIMIEKKIYKQMSNVDMKQNKKKLIFDRLSTVTSVHLIDISEWWLGFPGNMMIYFFYIHQIGQQVDKDKFLFYFILLENSHNYTMLQLNFFFYHLGIT